MSQPAPRPNRTASISLNSSVFVGRQREMAELVTSLEAALSGQGRLIMLAGEPGIGKTRTAQELATYAKEQGAQVLWGWCYEEGSLSLPYLPFVEALRDYVLSCETDDIRQELGTGASDVARIVPDVREKLQVELRQPGAQTTRPCIFSRLHTDTPGGSSK